MMTPPLLENEYLSLAKWRRDLRAPYLEGDGTSSRHNRFRRAIPAVGTWRLDDLRGLHGREIAVLVDLDPLRLIGSELDVTGCLLPDRRADAQRYEQWIRAGHRPPPVEVLETEAGQLKVTDGHRRLVASRNAGAVIQCWVSPTVDVPSGDSDSNGQPIKTGLTFEMWSKKGPDAFEGSLFCQSMLLTHEVILSPGLEWTS